MRKVLFLVAAVFGGLGLFSGCKKASELPPGAPVPHAINATAFRPAFASASPEIKAQVDQVMMDVQGSLYTDALNELAKLAANPSLTDAQKKTVADLADQVKQKMTELNTPVK